MEKISIVVPVYNNETYLSRCIESILAQTYTNFELLLINDGSTDESANICNRYKDLDERVVVIHQKNSGVSAARNIGISKAIGTYITFIDSDDWISVDALQKMIDIMLKNNVDCLRMSYFISTNDKNIPISTDIRPGLYTHKDIPKLIKAIAVGKVPSYIWLLLIRTSSLAPNIRFRTNIKMMEDTCFYIDLLSSLDSFYIANVPIYHYFLNSNGASKSPRHYIRNVNDILIVNKRIKSKLRSIPSIDKNVIDAMNATHANTIANYLFALFESSPWNQTQLIELFDQLHTNKDYIKLVNESDLNTIPSHLRFTIKAVVRHNYKNLLITFWTRLLVKTMRRSKI